DQSVDGHKGESFGIYDASRKVWHHSWVTNRGQLLIIEGNMLDSAMVLSGTDRRAIRKAACCCTKARLFPYVDCLCGSSPLFPRCSNIRALKCHCAPGDLEELGT